MNRPIRSLLLAAAIALALPVTAPRAEPFTFQGFLEQAGTPLNGSANLAFKLYDAQSAGSQIGSTLTANAWPVAAGVFSIDLDFTGVVFTGAQRWLQVEVNGTPLAGRIAVQPAPLAASANALRGFNVLGSTPTSGQVLAWNGSAWAPTAESGGGTYSAGNGLSLSGSTFSVNFAGSGAATTASRSDHEHYGQWWDGDNELFALSLENRSSAAGAAVLFAKFDNTASTGGIGIRAETNAINGIGMLGVGTEGVRGLSVDGANGAAVLGWRNQPGGDGVLGIADGDAATVAVRGFTNAPGGTALKGVSSNSGAGNGMGVHGKSVNLGGRGVYGEASADSGAGVGVLGESAGVAGIGVHGRALHASGVVSGVRGESSSSLGNGVQGNNTSTGGGAGVYGLSVAALGRGVLGVNQAATGDAAGVYGQTASGAGHGVVGYNISVTGSSGSGVYGIATSSSGPSTGVYGQSNSPDGSGVFGWASSASGSTAGIYGQSDSTEGMAVVGWATGNSGSNIGVYGVTSSASGYAGYFSGNVHVNGNFSASGTKAFLIDHPLDPANRVLYHYNIESPEPFNLYRGTVRLDAFGAAEIELPEYFEAINADFSYQLTAVGAAMPNLHVAREVAGNRFLIAGGVSGKSVSWQVTAARHDAWTRDRGFETEAEKPAHEKGYYLYPAGYGQDQSKAIGHDLHKRAAGVRQ